MIKEYLTESLFKELFYQFYDKIYTGFYRKTNSHEVSQDLAQLTFLNLWKYRSTFKPDLGADIQVFRKAKLVFIDWLRKEATQQKALADIRGQLPEAISQSDPDLREALSKAMAALPAVRKKVFTMAYIDGYSHKEIAEQLNISVKTVDAHVYQALVQLRKILAGINLFFILFMHVRS